MNMSQWYQKAATQHPRTVGWEFAICELWTCVLHWIQAMTMMMGICERNWNPLFEDWKMRTGYHLLVAAFLFEWKFQRIFLVTGRPDKRRVSCWFSHHSCEPRDGACSIVRHHWGSFVRLLRMWLGLSHWMDTGSNMLGRCRTCQCWHVLMMVSKAGASCLDSGIVTRVLEEDLLEAWRKAAAIFVSYQYRFEQKIRKRAWFHLKE